MSLIFKFPKYVFKAFIKYWLSFEEIIHIDSALVNKDRREFWIANLDGLTFPAESMYKWDDCFKWFIIRRCFISDLRLLDGYITNTMIFPDFSRLRKLYLSSGDMRAIHRILQEPTPVLEDLEIRCLEKPVPLIIDNLSVIPSSVTSLRLFRVLCWCSVDQITQIFSQAVNLTTLHIKETPKLDKNLLLPILDVMSKLEVAEFEGFEFFSGDNLLNELAIRCPLINDLSLDTKMRNLNETEPFDKFPYLKRLFLNDSGYSVEYVVNQ